MTRRNLLFVGIALVGFFLLILLPRRVARVLLFGGAFLSTVGAAWYIAHNSSAWFKHGQSFIHSYRDKTTPPPTEFTHLAARYIATETILVMVTALLMTVTFWLPAPNTQLAGREAQWLTGTAYVVAYSLEDYGYIPLWHPYNAKGEPLIDNPFAFPLNPISIAPTLITRNPEQGIKISVVLYAVLAATGGWFLAYTLNMGLLGRLLLSAMMLGKGNMVAMISTGFFQLGVQQAYIPWIIGAAILLIRLPRARWTIVLLALGFTLQFWAGNIWYTLPTLISVIAIVGLWSYTDRQALLRAWRRLVVAGVITIGLSAATLIPIFAKRAYIGGHRPLVNAGEMMDVSLVLQHFVEPSLAAFFEKDAPEDFRAEFYYSFVSPAWFVLRIVLIPPLYPILSRRRMGGTHRFMLIAAVLCVVFTMWGIGGLQPFRWMYNNLPGLGRWRFVGRALGAASFWFAVLVAMRVDHIWAAITNDDNQPYKLPQWLVIPLVMILAAAAMRAAQRVVTTWYRWDSVVSTNVFDSECAAWIRARLPDERLTIHQVGYDQAASFYRNRARLFPIEADYFAMPIDYGLSGNLIRSAYPQYAIPSSRSNRVFAIMEQDYRTLTDSPRFADTSPPCVMEKTSALPYAFSLPLLSIFTNEANLHPVTMVDYKPDRIDITVMPLEGEQLVAVISEVAYPGWRAYVNSEWQPLTPVGGYLGVLIEPGTDVVRVRFSYRPTGFLFGAGITITTAMVCTVYLLLPYYRSQAA